MSHIDQRYQRVQQQYNAGHDIHIVTPLSLTDAQQKYYRSRMLEKVRSYWITGVLEQSLHEAAIIELGLCEQPDAVTHPWKRELQALGQDEQLLQPNMRIVKVYDATGKELLILGEPGSGKTTLLLELTRDLLDRATRNETHPIPIVFKLSSWTRKRQPLKDWLIEELNIKYQVPYKLGQSWIYNDQMILLLDGLDEVAEEHRAECDAIPNVV